MIPAVFFVLCPGCGDSLELQTLGWQVAMGEKKDEDGGGHGIVLEVAAFGGHVCWSEPA